MGPLVYNLNGTHDFELVSDFTQDGGIVVRHTSWSLLLVQNLDSVPFGWTRSSYMTWPSWVESWFGPKWKAPKNEKNKIKLGVVKRFQNLIISYLNNPQSCVICHFNSRYWWLINIYFVPFFESFLHLKKIKISCLLNYVCGMIYDMITNLRVRGVA